MEEALFINKSEDIKYWNSRYSRVYFGAEFCQRLIPASKELKDVWKFSQDKKIKFTLITPFVTDEGLDKLRVLFKFLTEHTQDIEIVVNDWGVINFLCRDFPNFSLCLGRLLNKQKRGPRILNVTSKLPEKSLEYFKLPLGESILSTSLKEKLNIKRIELDNLLQGIKRQNLNIPASLYYPFLYVTTTRYCLVALAFWEEGFKRRTSFKCDRECQRYGFILSNKQMPVKIYLKGNTQFVKNSNYPHNLESLNIDRLVHCVS